MFLELKELEKNVFKNEKEDPEWDVHPSPDVRYQMNLEYAPCIEIMLSDEPRELE